jgi:hypothetical protein
MLAKMPITFSISDVLATDVTHLIATHAGKFIATRGFYKGCVAARTGAFDSQ